MRCILLCLMFLSQQQQQQASAFVSHTFVFTSLSYDMGVRHIHTPEYAIESHGLASPGFRILSTQQPDVIGEYAIIRFTYNTLIDWGEGVMFTRDKARSHMLLASKSKGGRAHLLATFEVQQNTMRNIRGHTLSVSPTLLMPATPLEKILCPVLIQQRAIEEALVMGYASNHRHNHEDPNLLAYRQMVLGSGGNNQNK